jgi:hypothetical protein
VERKKLVLCVIDGLPARALEHALEQGRLPALRFLVENGAYAEGTSTFPSVTPVCLSSIATGAGPDVHGIPHLVWYDREQERIVEYGSSFAAALAAGFRGTIQDAALNMSSSHLASSATTVFEALEDAGLVTGAINFTCYRGRRRHVIKLPEPMRRNRWYEAVNGPSRFFFFNLYESDQTGAPLAIRSRTAGSVDRYAASVGRWLVTRDGFDFLVYYLPDYDYAAHLAGPQGAELALERADVALGDLMTAAGGFEEFLDRYAIVVCSDHGQTRVGTVVRLADRLADLGTLSARRPRPGRSQIVVCASNRAAMLYLLPGARVGTRELAQRLDAEPAADLVLFREDRWAVARRAGEELRFVPDGRGFRLDGDAAVLDPERYPDGIERAWQSLACPRTGDVVVSAAEGYEFADLGGRHHRGGGSHGSLLSGDSLVPMLAAGFGPGTPFSGAPRIVDLKGVALTHFGLEPQARTPEAAGVA